jgi:hypothetical protein
MLGHLVTAFSYGGLCRFGLNTLGHLAAAFLGGLCRFGLDALGHLAAAFAYGGLFMFGLDALGHLVTAFFFGGLFRIGLDALGHPAAACYYCGVFNKAFGKRVSCSAYGASGFFVKITVNVISAASAASAGATFRRPGAQRRLLPRPVRLRQVLRQDRRERDQRGQSGRRGFGFGIFLSGADMLAFGAADQLGGPVTRGHQDGLVGGVGIADPSPSHGSRPSSSSDRKPETGSGRCTPPAAPRARPGPADLRAARPGFASASPGTGRGTGLHPFCDQPSLAHVPMLP